MAEKTGSAGSVSLIAQTLLPVLLFAESSTTLIIKGGTHVPWSPPAHYLAAVFLPALQEMEGNVNLTIQQWGFYPRGGGEINLIVKPGRRLKAVEWTRPPGPENFQGLSAAANLPDHVIHRQSQTLQSLLEQPLPIREEQAPSPGQGSFVFLWGPHAGFAALGERGKPAEQVAGEAARAFKKFIASRAGIDCHLADQISLYAALADGVSTFTTEIVTSHLLTNIWVIEQLLGVRFEVQGQLQEKGLVRVSGLGYGKF